MRAAPRPPAPCLTKGRDEPGGAVENIQSQGHQSHVRHPHQRDRICTRRARPGISLSSASPGSPSVKPPPKLEVPQPPSKRGRVTKTVSTRESHGSWNFFKAPRLAFLHRLVLGIHMVGPEVGAVAFAGLSTLATHSLDRWCASLGRSSQGNRHGEEALWRVSSRGERKARVGHKTCPHSSHHVARDDTCTGGL